MQSYTHCPDIHKAHTIFKSTFTYRRRDNARRENGRIRRRKNGNEARRENGRRKNES